MLADWVYTTSDQDGKPVRKIELDYKAIGLRIKNARTKREMCQERLAALSGLSTTHTSHIETGNTKVSLPALVQLANALEVSLDDLVCDSLYKARPVFESEIILTLRDCDEKEIRMIADVAEALKASLRKRL